MSWLQTVSKLLSFIFAVKKKILVTIERRIIASSCLLSNLDCLSLLHLIVPPSSGVR